MTKLVVDVGSARHGSEESVDKLICRFAPEVLYAIDPANENHPWPWFKKGDTWVVEDKRAAWVYNGAIDLTRRGLRATVMPDSTEWQEDKTDRVECFDFNHWLAHLRATELIVKLDCEGCEYVLLQALHESGTDQRIDLLLVEWHDRFLPERARQREHLERVLRCPREEWL